MNRIVGLAIVLSLGPSVTLPAQIHPIDALEPGHWLEIPGTRVRDVAPPSNIDGVFIGDVAAIMRSWSGGAYDPVNDRFFIKGGGHATYGGNEVYSLDIDSLQLSRIWGPSPFAGWTDGDKLMPDGAPVAAHSADHIEYVPAIDKFCTFTNTATWAWKTQWDGRSFCLDFATGQWNVMAQMPRPGNYMFGAVDPLTGSVFVHGGGSYAYLQEYDPINDVWNKRGGKWTDAQFYFGAYVTAAIDAGRRLFVSIGVGRLIAWDISQPGTTKGQLIASTGDREIESVGGPGLAHDPVSGLFVAWNGGTDVYVLDPDTWNWTRLVAPPTNTVIPTDTSETFGTYGRFQHIPSKNAFIAVASVDDNMFVYKLPASVQPDSTPPSTPTGLTPTLVGERRVELAWNPAIDDESGIKHYEVIRDGSLVATTSNPAYADLQVTPSTPYEYEIVAVNHVGLASSPSAPLTVTTAADVTPPVIVAVLPLSATSIRITFDELLDPATASIAANYQLSGGLVVLAAALDPDGKSVTLTTAPHGMYSVTVDGVADSANNAASGETANYSYP